MFSGSWNGSESPTPDTHTVRAATRGIVETDIPARLDRLPWGRFHTLVVAALGTTWTLDGLEVTLAGAVSGAQKESPALRFTNAEIGIASSAYPLGAVGGAIVFGWLTDRLGRKKLFFLILPPKKARTNGLKGHGHVSCLDFATARPDAEQPANGALGGKPAQKSGLTAGTAGVRPQYTILSCLAVHSSKTARASSASIWAAGMVRACGGAGISR